MDIHIYLHDGPDARVTRQLADILTQLGVVQTLGEKNLMASAELKAAMAKIDAETNALGDRVTALISKVGTGMSDADVAEVTDEANAIAARLAGIAADPNNPTP